MKRTLFALLVLFLTTIFTTGCFKSQVNSPGIQASGLSPKLPAPAYGHLQNDSKSLDYDYHLANKSIDYDMIKYEMLMNYKLKMNMAWQACLAEGFSEDSCAMIHGGWPYLMNYMGSVGYGYPYSSMLGLYPGCPYQDASYCQTWYDTQAYMQASGNLEAASNSSVTLVSQQYATAYANYLSAKTPEEQETALAEFKKREDELLGIIEKQDGIIEKKDAWIKKAKPVIESAAQ